ncbi:MAG: serine/threonine-protein kinase [Planctomycetota bacterium]
MKDTEIVLHALKLGSGDACDEFLAHECRNHPDQLARVLAIIARVTSESKNRDPLSEADLRELISSLVSEPNLLDPTRAIDTTGPAVTEAGESDVSPDTDDFETTLTPNSAAPYQGTTIAGRFLLREKLGEGGMGEVWVAKQIAPVKRNVALKLIKRGMDSRAVLQRFEQERQALAMMDHPNIASVLDGGVTDSGQSFFVMELVNGLPLTTFADKNKLTTNERIELFVAICNAVQHAHQKGIVHRDLKPANIIVSMIDGRPIPKVIDFGVAKATGGRLTEETVETQFGMVIGTLEYMAPEQASGSTDIDTRADIYSLGVVLYELLTGLRPIDQRKLKKAGLGEMIRIIKEEEPSKPSTRLSTDEALPSLAAVRKIEPKKLTALLRGELDWVVMRCLEKSRERRYETANGLARDLQRFLNGQAVEARPASLAYRASKFLNRNRGAVVASGLVLSTLLVGVAGTSWGWVESRRQAQLAQLEAATQSEINAFLRDDLLAQASVYTQSNSLFEPDPDLTVQKALERASRRIGERFGDRPLVAAAIHQTIGVGFSELGDQNSAMKHLEQAYKTYRDHFGPEHRKTYRAQYSAGYAMMKRNQLEDAAKHLAESLHHCQSDRGSLHREALLYKRALANCYAKQGVDGEEGKIKLAHEMYSDILNAQRELFADQPVDIGVTLFSQALCYRSESQLKDDPKLMDIAESLLTEALQVIRHLQNTRPERIDYQYTLGLIAFEKLDFERAFELHVEVLESCERTFGENDPTTIRAMDSLANLYSHRNRTEDAEKLYLKSLQLRQEMYGNDHQKTEHAVFALGQFYFNQGKMREAEPYYRERYDRALRTDGGDSVNVHLAGRDLAMIQVDLGKFDEAEKLLSDSLSGLEKQLDDDDPIVLLTRSYQADVLVHLKRYDEALGILQAGVEGIRAQEKPQPIELASALGALGECQMGLETFVDAEKSFREATSLFTKFIPQAWPRFVYQSRTGAALIGQQRYDEAEPMLQEAYNGIEERRQSCPPPLYRQCIRTMVQLYELMGRPEQVKRYRGKLDAP